MSEERILYNAIKTPDGTILESSTVHDFKQYQDKNGHLYMVDGGKEYLRRYLVKDAPYEELSIYDTGDHSIRRKHIKWGVNYDKYKNLLDHTEWRLIKDLHDEHIQAILKGNHVSRDNYYYQVFIDELKHRGIPYEEEG